MRVEAIFGVVGLVASVCAEGGASEQVREEVIKLGEGGDNEVLRGFQADIVIEDDLEHDRDEDDDDDDTCPFIYDEYEVDFKIAGQRINWIFYPKEYGLTQGFYCSISSSILGRNFNYRFDNCSCPIARQCNDDWAEIEADGFPSKIRVGKCELMPFALGIPLGILVVMFLSCGCVFMRACCRRTRREIIVVRAEPAYPYYNLN